jgi:hypothetical protein
MYPDHWDPPAKAGGNSSGGSLVTKSIATGFSQWFEKGQTNYWL